MMLGQRIKDCRQRCGLTQEQLAEKMSVSRQAVTKWESGQSAPSTENLFRLAEIFGTTVDFLLVEPETAQASPDIAPSVTGLAEDDSHSAVFDRWLSKLKDRFCAAAFVGLGYYLFFLVYKFFYCEVGLDHGLFYFLFKSNHIFLPYVFGWLLSSGMYLLSATISMFCALIGDFRTTLLTCLAFPAGIFLGEAFGQYGMTEEQISFGFHRGWGIWLCTYFGAVLLGIVINIIVGIIKLYLDGKKAPV